MNIEYELKEYITKKEFIPNTKYGQFTAYRFKQIKRLFKNFIVLDYMSFENRALVVRFGYPSKANKPKNASWGFIPLQTLINKVNQKRPLSVMVVE